MNPVDESGNDSSFRAFKQQLERAVHARDSSSLLKLVDPQIRNGFGGDDGAEKFQEIWNPEKTDSEIWEILETILSLGATDESSAEAHLFCAPYVFRRFPDELDPFEYDVVIRPDAPLRLRPDTQAPVVAKISYEIVKRLDWVKSDNGRFLDSWARVRTFDSKEGFMSARDVWSPIGYRACFQKKEGRWMMAFLGAGD